MHIVKYIVVYVSAWLWNEQRSKGRWKERKREERDPNNKQERQSFDVRICELSFRHAFLDEIAFHEVLDQHIDGKSCAAGRLCLKMSDVT